MKLNKKYILWTIIAWEILLWSPNSLWKTYYFSNQTEQLLIENLQDENHQEIVKSKMSQIIEKYWIEKVKEIINEHALIELNKYKKWSKYKYNKTLAQAAQNHADDMANNNYFKHENMKQENVWDRVDKVWWYEYSIVSENISFRDNLYEVIYWYTLGQRTWHDQIFEPQFEDVGMGFAKIKDPKRKWQDLYYFVFNFWKGYNP